MSIFKVSLKYIPLKLNGSGGTITVFPLELPLELINPPVVFLPLVVK